CSPRATAKQGAGRKLDMENIAILLLAVIFDAALGEPPNVIHPVAWMGKVASLVEKGSPRQSPVAQFIYGVFIVLITMAVFVVPTYFLLGYLAQMNTIIYIIVAPIWFKLTFSLRGLRRAALTIRELLSKDKLDEARFELRALVKRDTRELSPALMVSATVESVAENLTDSFVAPLFYFTLLGIPGAIGYRAVNTLDAMIGYRGKYEYLGKFASRLDTILNYLPARIAALFIILAALFSGKSAKNSWQIAFREHRKTASPNAGWTMAAAAGALGVQLEKTGHYRLGEANPLPNVTVIDASLRLVQVAALGWTAVCIAAGVIHYVVGT
ncbi:MAG: cobalamin biosynthesis protein, partial [Dehalococcoidales bacterium]|nr:cobalamin biosynthesis protein [Dehalococcoidales bacterium]